MNVISRFSPLVIFCFMSGISPRAIALDSNQDQLLSRNNYLNQLRLKAASSSTTQDIPKQAVEAASCDPFPIPTSPQGPTISGNLERFGEEFSLVAWRYPCDSNSSYVIFTITPKTTQDRPFVCSVQFTISQSGISDDTLQLVQDPVAAYPNSWCGDITQKTSFALIKRGISSDRIDLEKEFRVDFDTGSSAYQWDMFAYDPSAYGGGGGSGAELSNDAGVNGLFYDPSNSGHGFDIIRHETGLIVYYYGHSASGERLWLISDNYQADLEYNNEFRIDMYEIAEGTFGSPDSSPSKWGSIYLEFYDCDTGKARLNGNDGILEIDFVRLVGIPNLSCE